MPIIALSKGFSALVDEEDLERISLRSWAIRGHGERFTQYAYATIDGRNQYMHRYILNANKYQFVDHINRNGLDNRRCNIRLCDRAQNMANQKRALGASGFRGVHFDPRRGKYSVRAKINGHNISLGSFVDPVEAARYRDEFVSKHYGAFALLNFPEGEVGQ